MVDTAGSYLSMQMVFIYVWAPVIENANARDFPRPSIQAAFSLSFSRSLFLGVLKMTALPSRF